MGKMTHTSMSRQSELCWTWRMWWSQSKWPKPLFRASHWWPRLHQWDFRARSNNETFLSCQLKARRDASSKMLWCFDNFLLFFTVDRATRTYTYVTYALVQARWRNTQVPVANAGRSTRDLNLCHPASYRPLLTCPKTISMRAATRGVPLSRADSGSKLVAKFLS